jgi:hypothetical protein
MATNIEREENLLKVYRNTITNIYDENKKDDLLSSTDATIVVVFKDKEGIYPDGKVVESRETVTKYKYDYSKDTEGNITGCTVTKTINKTGQSTDYEKISSKTFYNKNGQIVRIEYYNRDGIVFRIEKMWYYSDGTLREKWNKGTHVIDKYYYNTFGKLTSKLAYTIKSKALARLYSAIYDKSGELMQEIFYDANYMVSYERDKDHTGHTLSKTRIFKHLDTMKIFTKETEIYDPNANYQLAKVIKNGITTKRNKYNLKDEIIESFAMNGIVATLTQIERQTNPDTGEKTIEKHIYTSTRPGEKYKSKYIKFVYSANENLLVYAEDNSIVTTYTYNDDNKREFAITRQLIDDKFVVISKIEYEYSIDPETGKNIRTRTEEMYDKDGNLKFKESFKESKSDIEQVSVFEKRNYEIPN